MKNIFYKCIKSMVRDDESKFLRGCIYKVLDHDKECILFLNEAGEYYLVDTYNLRYYFRPCKLMPEMSDEI